MIKVEGYKAFHGVMRITPIVPRFEPFEIEADWLYKPDTDCWYGNGRSFEALICKVVKEASKACEHNYVEKQVEKGVTVQVLECADCGDISVGWYREKQNV